MDERTSGNGEPTDEAPGSAAGISALFDGIAICVEGCPSVTPGRVYAAELAHVAGAVDKRRAEFLTARVLARRALHQLSISAEALVPGTDRAPTWPRGVVGTITHTDDYCAVAVAPATRVRSLGLDAETDTPLSPDLLRLVCTPREQRFLQGQPANRQLELAKLFFSAKEAFYKCQYPVTQTFLDFLQVELDLDLPANTFTCHVLGELGTYGREMRALRGRFRRANRQLLTGVLWPLLP